MILVLGQNGAWQLTYRVGALSRGEVNRMDEAHGSAAGKGANAARALTILGADVRLLTYAGGSTGDRYLADCRADGIQLEAVSIAEATRICTTIIEDDYSVTEIIEPPPAVTRAESDNFMARVEKAVADCRLLVISGTAVTGEHPDRYRDYVEAAHRSKTPVLLDSYREHGKNALKATPEFLKINAAELSDLSGRPTATFHERRDACRELIATYGIRWIIITLGSEGAEGYTDDGEVRIALPRIQIVNSIGAGDSFTGGVASSIACSMRKSEGAAASNPVDQADIVDACKRGAAAGTANCLDIKPGRFEIDRFREYLSTIEVL